MKLIWSKKATKDLEQIGEYISRDAPERARNYLQTLIKRAKQAAEFPQAGRVVPEYRDEKIREIIESNYRIVYEIDSAKKTITVLTVFDGHRLLNKKT